jgi:hypothetical protein
MTLSLHSLVSIRSLLCLVTLFVSASGQQVTPPAPDEKKSQPRLRLICVECLEQDQQVGLATRDEKGEWRELGKAGIRSSFISDWMPASAGELHLTVPGTGGPQSICKFTYPEGARRALVVLIPDKGAKVYRPVVYDPDKLAFAKGSVLVANFSSRSGMVVFGTKRVTVKPGDRSVVKPTPEPNGMYRMLVAYEDENGKPVPCYDRYVQENTNSRDLLFLIPDAALGLKAFSLPIFGAFD